VIGPETADSRPGDKAPFRSSPAGQPVPGQRETFRFWVPASMQNRASNALAATLLVLAAGGMLGWYYSRAVAQPQQAVAGSKVSNRAAVVAEVPLPPLGRVFPSAPQAAPTQMESSGPQAWHAPEPLAESSSAYQAASPTPARQALERRLTAEVFAGRTVDPGTPSAMPLRVDSQAAESVAASTVVAQRVPDMRLLMPKGTFIDCTLETAIDSTLAGMTTCITATDTFGADGTVVLLERGTKLIGELRGQVQQGAARIFVLWTEARTHNGVIVHLDSPGADELGRTGLAGAVNRHFWQRFGAAMLVTAINGTVQAVTQSRVREPGAITLNSGGVQDLATEALKSTIGIAPTVVKAQGDRIQILVARDLDFRTVYELHALTRSP